MGLISNIDLISHAQREIAKAIEETNRTLILLEHAITLAEVSHLPVVAGKRAWCIYSKEKLNFCRQKICRLTRKTFQVNNVTTLLPENVPQLILLAEQRTTFASQHISTSIRLLEDAISISNYVNNISQLEEIIRYLEEAKRLLFQLLNFNPVP